MPFPIADDYYELLGIHAGANDAELRRAWRGLAARWHPDRAGTGATAMFQRLSAAYTVLSDPVARAAYDRRRRRTVEARDASGPRPAAAAAAAAAAASPPSHPARPAAPAAMLSRITGSLMSLLARGAAHLDEPGYITLMLGDAEAARGGMAQVSLHVDLRCPDCAARGRSAACARCDGSGTVEELYSAWLAIRPGATSGEVLVPSVDLPGMVEPVRFRLRVGGTE